MPESPTSKKRLTARMKAKKGLELRITGMTFQAIADTGLYNSPQAASKAINKELERTMQEPSEQLRKMEAERLDRLMESIWAQAVSGDKDATWKIDRILNIMERRAKLLALDKAGEGGDDIGRLADTFLAGANTMEAMQVKDLSE